MSVLAKERVITAQTLTQYIPEDQETTQLVALNNQSNGNSAQYSYENERDLLYKILYELRGNVAKLKQEVEELKKKTQTGNDEQTQIREYSQGNNMTTLIPMGSNGMSTPQMGTQSIRPSQRIEESVQDAVAEEISEPESLNLEDVSRIMLEKALEKSGGNRKKAAKELGISDRTLYRKLRHYGKEGAKEND